MKHLFHLPHSRHQPNTIATIFHTPSPHHETPFHLNIPRQVKPPFHQPPPSHINTKLMDIFTPHHTTASKIPVFHKNDIIHHSVPVLNTPVQDNYLLYAAGALIVGLVVFNSK